MKKLLYLVALLCCTITAPAQKNTDSQLSDIGKDGLAALAGSLCNDLVHWVSHLPKKISERRRERKMQESIISEQDTFLRKLDTAARSMARDAQRSGIKVVAVFDLRCMGCSDSALRIYTTENLIISLVNTRVVKVVDRNHLKEILREHKLSSDGFLDPANRKELGRFTQADGLVTGTVTIVGNQFIKISLQVLDIETANIAATCNRTLPMDGSIKNLLHIMPDSNGSDAADNSDWGGSGQQGNASGPEIWDCKEKKTADIFFENYTNKEIVIEIRKSKNGVPIKTLYCQGGETQPAYHLFAGTYYYYAYDRGKSAADAFKQSELLIEPCHGGTIHVKDK